MKFAIFVVGLTVFIVTKAEPCGFGNWRPRLPRPILPRIQFGNYRFRRSLDPVLSNSLFSSWNMPLSGPDRRPTSEFGYNYNLFDNYRGTLGSFITTQKFPGQGYQANVGKQGALRFGEKHTFFTLVSKPLSGPETRPTYTLGYYHNFMDNDRGSLEALIDAEKLPGQGFESTAEVQGELRFGKKDSISASVIKPLSGPEHRPTYNLGYNHQLVDNDKGSLGISVGAEKRPGQEFEPTVGLQGELRFRREANSDNYVYSS